ncbi:hypothetical protein L596_005105 [Steinernema carpocapsae]|uniref:Uncharacterized protein n=1 Tax=Steinernema carpocapsae TaxID=34508 RepID=A0A4V6I8J1_STECR|nr:hypothetical protein L596_005105 [Steinernema carpocapsae]
MSKPKPKMLQEASPSLLSPLFERAALGLHTPLPGAFGAETKACGGIAKPTEQTRERSPKWVAPGLEQTATVGAAGATE